MYYFKVTPTNEIHCFNSETNEFIAKAESLFIRSEQNDFWTSIKINNVLYDINICEPCDDMFPAIGGKEPVVLSLYELDDNDGNISISERYNNYPVEILEELKNPLEELFKERIDSIQVNGKTVSIPEGVGPSLSDIQKEGRTLREPMLFGETTVINLIDIALNEFCKIHDLEFCNNENPLVAKEFFEKSLKILKDGKN